MNTYFKTIPSNCIKPSGWLKRQLEIQAEGLCGNLDIIWPDVANSKWIGGSREGWERAPYWLDGFIPMAYLLEREDLIKRAEIYIDAIISKQEHDGWICPCEFSERENYDVWAYMLICKVLTVYADCSGKNEIVSVLRNALTCLYGHIKKHPVFNWAKMRWFECLIPVYWLYDRTGEEWLLNFAKELKKQGFDYRAYYEDFKDILPKNEWRYDTHVVNTAIALKSESLYSLADKTANDPDSFALLALEKLYKYHGMAAFHFTGDECLAGSSPNRGSELCGVVEAMYSYEQLLSASGNPYWADLLERVAFNTLPATVSEDMWTHQYDQMTNQPQCSIMPEGKAVFGTNNGESDLFGLEPNYGCCTANFGQGFPKFALSSYMQYENGIAATLIVPSVVTYVLNGTKIRIECITNYPFSGTVKYIIETEKPVEFGFSFRIPLYTKSVILNGNMTQERGYIKIHKEWQGREEIDILLEFETVFEKRNSGMYNLVRGPLLYALPVRHEKVKHEYTKDGVERVYPYCDYELFPKEKWNYAFVNEKTVFIQESIGKTPFSESEPPCEIKVNLTEVEWGFENGYCADTASSPIPGAKTVEKNFIPYGCTKLRMAEIPLLLNID